MYSRLLSENHTACVPETCEYEIWMSKRAFNVETVKKCLIRFVSGKFPYVIYIFTSVSSQLIIVIHIRVQYTVYNVHGIQSIAFYLYYFPCFSILIHIFVFALRLVGRSVDCSSSYAVYIVTYSRACRCTFWIYSFAWQIHSGAMKYIRYHSSGGTKPPPLPFTLYQPKLHQHFFAWTL